MMDDGRRPNERVSELDSLVRPIRSQKFPCEISDNAIDWIGLQTEEELFNVSKFCFTSPRPNLRPRHHADAKRTVQRFKTAQRVFPAAQEPDQHV